MRLPGWRQIYELFATHLLPRVGGWITGERGDYEYLQESSAAFPCGEKFLRLFEEAGGYGVDPAEALSISAGIGGGAMVRRPRKLSGMANRIRARKPRPRIDDSSFRLSSALG